MDVYLCKAVMRIKSGIPIQSLRQCLLHAHVCIWDIYIYDTYIWHIYGHTYMRVIKYETGKKDPKIWVITCMDSTDCFRFHVETILQDESSFDVVAKNNIINCLKRLLNTSFYVNYSSVYDWTFYIYFSQNSIEKQIECKYRYENPVVY